jgi:hypothetical protein
MQDLMLAESDRHARRSRAQSKKGTSAAQRGGRVDWAGLAGQRGPT